MGLFDTILLRATCPYCGLEKEFRFQTKALENVLRTYRLGDKVLSDELEIYDGLIKNCIETCSGCKNFLYADIGIEEGKILGIKEIKKEDIKKDWKS